MIAVREEDIKKLYSSIYDIAAIVRTSPEQVLSWVRSGDLYFGIGTKKDNKILVHKNPYAECDKLEPTLEEVKKGGNFMPYVTAKELKQDACRKRIEEGMNR